LKDKIKNKNNLKNKKNWKSKKKNKKKMMEGGISKKINYKNHLR
jgi:hypothetical protein